MARLLPPESDIGLLRAPVRSSLMLLGLFLIVLFAVALLERIGVRPGFAPFAVVTTAFALFVLAALYAHSRRAADFYVADRRVSAAFSGLAAASVFAGLLAAGLVGGAYRLDASFAATAAGLAAGFVVLAVGIAPHLRALKASTAGDFIALRFSGRLPRLAWALIAFAVSFLLLLAHLKLSTPLIASLLGVTPRQALYVAAALTAMAALPGGMRSLSWAQAIQYSVIALACVLPSGFFASAEPAGGNAATLALGTIAAEGLSPLGGSGAAGWALPFLVAALGAAALPSFTARGLTAFTPREAGTGMLWAVLFSLLLVVAGFALFDLLASSTMAGGAAEAVPATLADAVAGLPGVLAGLLLAGALSALFALGEAALFAAATALSHDLWDEMIDRRGPEGRRIIVARLALIGVAAGAVAVAPLWRADAAALAAWSLALAAAGSFFPLLLGLWWRRCNEIGAIGGMVAGFGFTGLVFLMDQDVIPPALVTSGWSNVGSAAAGVAGILMSLVVTIGLSLVTPAPEGDLDDRVRPDERGERLPIRERPA